MKNNLGQSLKNAMNKSNSTSTFDSDAFTQAARKGLSPVVSETQIEDVSPQVVETLTPEQSENPAIVDTKAGRKKREKPLFLFGIACIIAFAIAMSFSSTSSVDVSEAAKNALEEKVSTSLSVGTILLSKDENIGQQDYTIIHNTTNQDSTKIWIWDYAAEDGDYVQILVNGIPNGAPFMIKHKPVELALSLAGLTGTIQVQGVKDGGGGITYAIRYELNNTTYFNSSPENELNTYTLEIGQ